MQLPAHPEAPFSSRHIGPNAAQTAHMLQVLGYGSVEELISAAVPPEITREAEIPARAALPEAQMLAQLRAWASENQARKQMIGQGFYDTVTPAVLRRHVLENPAWYTAYTPYQPEISQGRLEAQLLFQTAVSDLTGLPLANASLLDEASAAAEAIALARRAQKQGAKMLVDAQLHPQVLAVAKHRAQHLDIPIEVTEITAETDFSDCFGVMVAQITTTGGVRDLTPIVTAIKAAGALAVVNCDLLALTLITDPGSLGADVAFGSAGRFGTPLFYGGPHAAFMSVRAGMERTLPGRLVGVSKDADGRPAYRLTLQTREQHIRRERATSNICTAQALLAVLAGLYAAWHGPEGLIAIAARERALATRLAAGLQAAGVELVNQDFFDTVAWNVTDAQAVRAGLAAAGINVRVVSPTVVAASLGESHTAADVDALLAALGYAAPEEAPEPRPLLPARSTTFLTDARFHAYRSETAMMRYLRALADKDLALDRCMIPLGSCTMKLNPAAAMEAMTWPEFAGIHPYAPAEQTRGWEDLIADLKARLIDITGYDAVSLQPNAGSQGELSGLLAIRRYHDSRGDHDRRLCLIPKSAHGTNAASAMMAGLTVKVIETAPDGSIDVEHLRQVVGEVGPQVAAIMITYPSTHGVFEHTVTEVCDLVHGVGGQVYIDGANLNALVGIGRPGRFGGDVSHLNLHKTFAIPHGGGGPGVGPVVAKAHLAEFLPGDPLVEGSGPVAASLEGSAGILPITWAYLAMMGTESLRKASAGAILAANYLARELHDSFPVLYTGQGDLVAHECILDLRPLTDKTGVTAEDVAKRLVDCGFHAPTLAFPVPGTLMVEPTESEPLEELDRFIAAMRAIRAEIDRVAAGEWPVEDSPLRHAPHPLPLLFGEWTRPYSREQAFFPLGEVTATKYFPPVSRIDNAWGDRNLQCTCPPLSDYQED